MVVTVASSIGIYGWLFNAVLTVSRDSICRGKHLHVGASAIRTSSRCCSAILPFVLIEGDDTGRVPNASIQGARLGRAEELKDVWPPLMNEPCFSELR